MMCGIIRFSALLSNKLVLLKENQLTHRWFARMHGVHWLMSLPHSKKIIGLNHWLCRVEFAYSSRVCMGSLQVLLLPPMGPKPA